MSFTKRVKNEISKIDQDVNSIYIAEMKAICYFNGQIYTSPQKAIRFTTTNYSVARRIFFLLKNISKEEPTLIKPDDNSKQNIEIFLEGYGAGKLISELDLIDSNGKIKRISKKESRAKRWSRGFLRGAFMMNGYIASPEKSYHLEIEIPNEDMKDFIIELMKKFNIKNISSRKDNSAIYLKNGEEISLFLSVIEAHQSLLYFEDERALKEIRNRINRRVNFEAANLGKTVDASVKQVKSIEMLKSSPLWIDLNQSLKDIAELRLKHRSASMREIGELSDPPISKSTVNHRFRRLIQLAEEIQD